MTSPIPTKARIASETDALQLLGRCGCCIARAQSIPFQPEWLRQSEAAASIQITAALMLGRSHDLSEAQGTADWLRSVAHELDALVLREQIKRTRQVADEQSRAHAARKQRSRLEQDADVAADVAAAIAALDAFDGLIDGRGTEGVL